jgi:hypothetical protein
MRLGKGKFAIYLAFFLFISASAGGQAGKNYKYQLNGDLQIADVKTEGQSLIINYSLPEISLENTTNSSGTFYRVRIPGHTPTVATGKPELPVYSRIISVPEGSGFKIRISEIKSKRLKPSGKKITGILYPVQEGETKQQQKNRTEFQFDKYEYARKGIIASDTVRIEKLGKIRETSLANLLITPARYNPGSNSIEVITSMRIEIIFSSPVKSTAGSHTYESSFFNNTLLKGVLNYNPGEVVTGYTDQPVKMVIITDTAFRKQLQPFLKWKLQKGFKVSVLYKGTGTVGSTYAELKDTLTKIYNASDADNPAPQYLLIIGDVNRIPYYGAGGSGNVTDMYYGEFDGNGDYIPEMLVGRIPVADTTELKNVIQKLIQYEKFQFAGTNKFYSSAVGAAGADDGYATYMNGQLNYLTGNYLIPQNNITEHHFLYPSSLTMEKDSIIKLVNTGTSLINYTGHGDASGWLHVNIKVADTAKFLNNNMYPLIISNACQTARFSTKYSFGNRMVVSGKKGAIGFIGCSNDSYWDEDYYWSVGAGDISSGPTYETTGLGAFDRLFHTHSESPSEWYYTLGQINFAGNMAVSESTSSRKKYYWETYNVIGDPSLIPIIGTPKTFNGAIPDTLPNAMQSLYLNTDPFAYVAVSHFDTLWDASFASTSGSVELKMPGISNDSCLIVITGQNKYPVIKTVYFSNIDKEFINLTSSAISDAKGNNNSKADFDESISLQLKINNLGSADAGDLYAKISSESSWITITADSVYIGTLNAGSETVISDKLNLKIAANVPDLSVATVKLMLKDSKTENKYYIDIVIHSPVLDIASCVMDDITSGNANYIADPGETFNLIFKVSNLGSSDISGLLNTTSPSGGITILQSNVKSGLLKLGETTDIPVTVKLAQSVPSGTVITVSSTLACPPFIIKKEFTFRVGRVRESFEASSFNVFPWINLSSIPWTITGANSFEGTISAKSGAITHNGTSTLSMKTVYSDPDTLKFYYKVSSETNYDYLTFSLNGAELFKKSGEIPWTQEVIALPAGINKLEWKYKKDQSVTGGADCAWIDMIDFAVNGTVTYIQKDLKAIEITGPEQKDKLGLEEVKVKVLNTGKDILNGFNMAYSVNDHQPVTQFFENQLIPDGDTVTVSFKVKADLTKYGIYQFHVYGYDNNDDYLNNDTVSVKVENTTITETVSAFPNPFKDQITVVINAGKQEKIRITLISVSGVKMQIFEKEIIKGMNSIVLPFPNLTPSLYYLNLKGEILDKTIPVLKVTR